MKALAIFLGFVASAIVVFSTVCWFLAIWADSLVLAFRFAGTGIATFLVSIGVGVLACMTWDAHDERKRRKRVRAAAKAWSSIVTPAAVSAGGES